MMNSYMHMAPWTPGDGFTLEEDAATTSVAYQRRRDLLVNSIEASGVGCAEHLHQLSLEQLEEVYKMSGSYDEAHYHSSSTKYSSSSNGRNNESAFHQFWKFVLSEDVWWGHCFHLYPAAAAATATAAAADRNSNLRGT